VALFCGLDYSREVGTHFAQEKLLKDQFQLAQELQLPVVLYQV
jgi:Tat protein secretion system quality control protein TatD with DNase activity